jgi:hypothetical protein
MSSDSEPERETIYCFGAFWVKGTVGVANERATESEIVKGTVGVANVRPTESEIELYDQIDNPTGLKKICLRSVAAYEDEESCVCWIGAPG